MSKLDATSHHGRWPKDERMHEDQGQDCLPLKNGGQVNVRHALIELESLSQLLKDEPRHFAVLLQLARNEPLTSQEERTKNVSSGSVDYLKQAGYLSKRNASIRPLIRDLLLSAYAITPDGPAMVQPFALVTIEHRDIADRILREIDQSRSRWLRAISSDRKDPPSR